MRNTDLGMRHLKGVDFFMTARMKRSAIRENWAANPCVQLRTHSHCVI